MEIICHELYGSCRSFLLVKDLVVDKSYRSRAIGVRLVSALEDEGRNRDCYQIIFITETDREDTVKIYVSPRSNSLKNKGLKREL